MNVVRSFQKLRIHYHHGNFSLPWQKLSLELHPSDTLPLTPACFLLRTPHVAMHLVYQEFVFDASTSTSLKSMVGTNLPSPNIFMSASCDFWSLLAKLLP